ncbi:MAG: TonB-dependent receptor [Bdellovibrionales bacterium]|nr:TonB-dependent receptor [Bdellovibrionales bacterium]
MKLKFKIAILIVVAGTRAWAQEAAPVPALPSAASLFTVEGTLLERGTKKPLEGVNVFVLPAKVKAITDVNGRFKIDGIPEGDIEWVVNLSGYMRLKQSDRVDAANAGTARTLRLERSYYQVFETTVTDKVVKRDQITKSLTTEEFLKVPGAGGDPVKAVQNLPGVNRSPGFSSQVVIQGSGPLDTAYQIQGIEVPLVFHFGGLSSVMFPEAVERVDYLSAGYGAENGRGQGGIVGLWARDPRSDRYRGLAFVDILNAGALAEGPAGKDASFLVAGRQSYIGFVLDKVLPSNSDFDLTVAPSFRDFTGIYLKKWTDQDKLKITFIASDDQLQFLIKHPVEADASVRGTFNNRTTFYRLIPEWTHRFGEDLTGRFSLGAGADHIRVDLSDDYFRVFEWTLSSRAELEKTWMPEWKSFVGWDHSFAWANYDIRLPALTPTGGVFNPFSTGETRIASGHSNYEYYGFYLRNDVHPAGTGWTLSPNVRLDYIAPVHEWAFAPRPAVRYEIDPSFSLRGSGGLYFQQPEPGNTDASFGNPDIHAMRSTHVDVGLDKDFRGGASDGWNVSSDVFYKHLDRQIIPSTRIVTRNGEQVPENVTNDGQGEVYGWQSQVKFRKDIWTASLIYTISKSVRWDPDHPRYNSPFDQTHLVGFLASVDLSENWSFGTRIRYSTGTPFTPVAGGVYDADNDVFIPVRGAFYSERLASFFQWDIRIDKKWVFDSWILSAYADLQNITNRKNPEAVNYSYDYKQRAVTTGLPALAILGVKGEF